MAERRFLSKAVLYQDSFMAMSVSAKVLYVELVLHADDDGFVDNIRTVRRLCRAKPATLRELNENGYVHVFSDNLLVILHWNVMNKVPPSKYCETRYKAEKQQLEIDEHGVYQLKNSDKNQS